MKFQEFESAPLGEDLKGVYLLLGEETYFQEAAFDRIRSALSERHPGFEFRRYAPESDEEAARLPVGKILDDLRTPSLFTAATLVRFDRAQKVLVRHGETFEAYCSGAGEIPSILVLLARSIDRRTRVARAVARNGVVVECDRLFDAPPPWKRNLPEHDHPLARRVVSEFLRRGKRVDLPLAHALASRVGNDLFQIVGEIEKILLHAGEAAVSKADLDLLVADRRQNKLYDLTASVFAGRTGEAVRRLERLFETGIEDAKGNLVMREEPIAFMLSATLASGYRRIRSALSHLRGVPPGRSSQERLASELRMRPFAAGRLADQARQAAGVDPRRVLGILARLDSELKGGVWTARLATLRAVGQLGIECARRPGS